MRAVVCWAGGICLGLSAGLFLFATTDEVGNVPQVLAVIGWVLSPVGISRKAAATAVLLLVAAGPSVALATSVPIMEFRKLSGAFTGTPQTQPLPFGLGGGMWPNSAPQLFDWTTYHTAEDVGQSFFAPPEVVQGAQNLLYQWRAVYSIQNPFSPDQYDVLHNPPYGQDYPCDQAASFACLTFLAPDLRDYYVTAIERTIDELTIKPASLTAEQTITYWGDLKPALPGDYNRDMEVNAADYVLWRKRLNGVPALPNSGGLPYVAASDYGFWQANFGDVAFPAPGLAAGGIPEPATIVLLLLAIHYVAPSRYHRTPSM